MYFSDLSRVFLTSGASSSSVSSKSTVYCAGARFTNAVDKFLCVSVWPGLKIPIPSLRNPWVQPAWRKARHLDTRPNLWQDDSISGDFLVPGLWPKISGRLFHPWKAWHWTNWTCSPNDGSIHIQHFLVPVSWSEWSIIGAEIRLAVPSHTGTPKMLATNCLVGTVGHRIGTLGHLGLTPHRWRIVHRWWFRTLCTTMGRLQMVRLLTRRLLVVNCQALSLHGLPATACGYFSLSEYFYKQEKIHRERL